jgi:hypothetical protein
MCAQVRREMRPEVRTQEITRLATGRMLPTSINGGARLAGQRLLETYASLAARGEHLLQDLLAGQLPRQWRHYPDDDAIDEASGYQWFYHSHPPEERPGAAEHGHFHLFARRRLWSRRLQSQAEKDFATLVGSPSERVNTRHLLGIGIDAKGIPVSLFTVNSWVTGDLMLSAASTSRLLTKMTLDTGHPAIDAMLESVITLCPDEVRQVLAERDAALCTKPASTVLGDRTLEVLSETFIGLDQKLQSL